MKVAIVDIETTGFLNKGGKIVEVGMVELDTEDGSTITLFDQVMHEKGITKEEVENSWIIQNSSLTLEEIRHSKNLEHYRPELQDLFNRYKVTAFNKKFDFGFFRDRGFVIENELPCPMMVSIPICKRPFPSGRGGWKFPSVTEATAHFFPELEDYEEAHRGASDAHDEAKIVFELIKRGHIKLD